MRGLALLLGAACVGWAAPDFAREIKPIFERSCAGCHGAKAQMGGLRLDSKALAAKSIKAGDSGASSLYQRVAGVGDQARMPMGAKPLAAAEIALIKDWIDQGAVWPDALSVQAEVKKHWAFTPPKKAALPAGVSHPVDHFIRTKLAGEGLQPSPEAPRATLLRRLSLDLTGLPPTPAEVDAFVHDRSPNAYRKQVERLLASPHYGERWGRFWLDAARYADSDGYEKDKQRQVWFYRDWVVNALNRDLPYDRFIIEQIAGDLLPGATQDQRVATGFLRNSMINEEGGIEPEQFRMEAMFDRMDALGKAVLGVTIQCAQCHNHKYDPIAQEDYYRVFAFLNNSHESNIAVYTPEEQKARGELLRRIASLEAGLKKQAPDWKARMRAWEASAREGQPVWKAVLPEVDDISTGGQKYLPMPDGSLLAQGYAPTKHKVKLTLKPGMRKITALRVELLNDPNLPMGGPGRSIEGTGALSEIEAEIPGGESKDAKPVKLKFARATADVNPEPAQLKAYYHDKQEPKDGPKLRLTGPVEFAIDGKETTAWGHDVGPVQRNLPRKAVFEFAEPVSAETLVVYLNQRHGGWNSDDNQNHNLGRFRISVTTEANAAADPVPAAVREILAIGPSQRTAAQDDAVFAYWRTTVAEFGAANEQIAALWKQHPEGSSQLVLREREQPRETHVLARGDFLKPGKKVEPGPPPVLNPMPPGAPANRLGFAQWLVDRNAPTTARSIVNRVWQQYFGTGIVATVEDLGKQSEAPSHPELLDWLAVEFMEKGWSLKQLHRTIVMSAAYRQSSKTTPELLAKDPYNRLLARGPRLRVEGEVVRDIALTASGLLSRKMGGPSVYPPAPEFLFQPPVSYGPKIWNEAKGEDRYRRALYTFRYRSVPYPMLQTFDSPNGDAACVRRARSNTPLQALTTLNEPLFVESARALAMRALREGGKTDAERLAYAFKLCTSRAPEAGEVKEMMALLGAQSERFAAGGVNPWDLAAEDPAKPPTLPAGVTPAQAAAWTALSRVLLNLDETITKE